MSENCLTCKFSRGQSEGLTCHRNPPYRDDRWAMTPDNESCGEFKPAELNVVSPDASDRLVDGSGYQPVRPPGTPDVPPEELTPPSGESAISGPPAPKKPHAKPPRRKGEGG